MSKWAWCLVQDNNQLSIGWNKVGDYWYYFYSNGQMASNEWININGDYYRVNEGGQMITGWFNDATLGKWYYLEPMSNGNMGKMYKDCTITLDGKQYNLDSTGVWLSSNVSDKLIECVKELEGFNAKKYDDGCGVITQGYGQTGNEITSWGDTVSEETASSSLIDLLNNIYAPSIKSALESRGITLSQNQFDALVSMSYNIGTDGVINSTLFKDICNGVTDKTQIQNDFLMWSKGVVDGKLQTIQGLYKRRLIESHIYLDNNYTTE